MLHLTVSFHSPLSSAQEREVRVLSLYDVRKWGADDSFDSLNDNACDLIAVGFSLPDSWVQNYSKFVWMSRFSFFCGDAAESPKHTLVKLANLLIAVK